MNILNNIIDSFYLDKNYYMINNEGELEILDNQLSLIRKINNNIKYSTITYDNTEREFYLSEVGNKTSIYKSANLEEYTVINLPFSLLHEIKHLSYSSYYKKILITTNQQVYMLNLANNTMCIVYEIKEKIETEFNDCIRPLCCNNNIIILSGAFFYCKEIYINYIYCGISYISKLYSNNIQEIIYKTRYLIKSTLIIENELWVLIDKIGNYDLVYTGIDYYCEGDSTDCNCQIVESIALVEKNIAKILGSEALKIKAAIDKSNDIKDLLCINNSVNDLVYHITVLEFILTEKLKTIKKGNCECE